MNDRADDSAALCPECATPLSARTFPPPSGTRLRLMLQTSALLVALIWLGLENWQSMQPMSSPGNRSGGTTWVNFPREQFTRADIERLADSGRSTRLLDAISEQMVWQLRTTELTAAFNAPTGYYVERWRYGWPLDLVVYNCDALYDDAYARRGVIRQPFSPWSKWSGWTHIRAFDVQGRAVNRSIYLPALSGVALVLIAACGSGRLLRSLLIALSCAGRGTRMRDRLTRRIPLFFTATLLVVVIVLSARVRHETAIRSPVPAMPPTAPVGLTVANLLRLDKNESGDAAVAEAILAATAEMLPRGETLLVGWKTPPTTGMSGSIGWPLSLCSYFMSTADAPAPIEEPSLSIADRYGSISVIHRRIAPTERLMMFTLSPHAAATLILMLYAAWAAPRTLLWLTQRVRSNRTVKRVQRGLCVRCGYDIRNLSRGSERSPERQ